MKKVRLTILALICLLMLSSCYTTRIAAQKEPSDTFLADIDEFCLGDINCNAAVGINRAKVTDLYFYSIPRTNDVEVRFTLGIDYVDVCFTYADRLAMKEAFNTYLLAIQAGSLEDRKPTKKNAFHKGKVYVAWGMTGFTHSVDGAEYFSNYEFVEENKPYFKLQFNSAPEEGKEDVYSPYFCVYLTPAQIRTIMQICDQKVIQAEVDRVLAEAYTFDDFDYNGAEEQTAPVEYSFDDE